MKRIELCVVMIILLVLSLVAAGCQEPQQSKVWGEGELSANWQSFFGNGNLARLNFVQTEALNQQGQAMAELAERVRKLEALVFIDPNSLEVSRVAGKCPFGLSVEECKKVPPHEH